MYPIVKIDPASLAAQRYNTLIFRTQVMETTEDTIKTSRKQLNCAPNPGVKLAPMPGYDLDTQLAVQI